MTPFLKEEGANDLSQAQQNFSEENLQQENAQTIQQDSEQNQQIFQSSRQQIIEQIDTTATIAAAAAAAPTAAPAPTLAPTPAPIPAPTTSAAPAIALRQECFTRICDQTISGRQLVYDRALEIIQDEEYLNDVDFDEIKRQRLKRQISILDAAEKHFSDSIEKILLREEKHHLLKRQKRDLEWNAAVKAAFPVFSNNLFTTYGFNPGSGGINTFAMLTAELATFSATEKSQFCSYVNTFGLTDVSSFVCHSAALGEYPRQFPNLDG